MTYTLKQYRSYQDYLADESLSGEKDYRLLASGEVIEVPTEDELNRVIAYALIEALLQLKGIPFLRLIRRGDKELQVPPEGDNCVNRKPDVMLLDPTHLDRDKSRQAITFGMSPPAFVAEVVSPGGETSDSYQRDYIWKRQQYQWWQIPEYWIIDPHRQQVTVLTLVNGVYQEQVFRGPEVIISQRFSELRLTVEALLRGKV